MVSEVEIATTMRARGRRRTRSPNGEIRMSPVAYLSGSSDVAKNQKQGIIETYPAWTSVGILFLTCQETASNVEVGTDRDTSSYVTPNDFAS